MLEPHCRGKGMERERGREGKGKGKRGNANLHLLSDFVQIQVAPAVIGPIWHKWAPDTCIQGDKALVTFVEIVCQ
jgi:hypothetical protein